LVFTANAAVVLDGTVLLARFRCPERQGEEPHFRRFFEGLRARGLVARVDALPEGVYLEGAGDCYWDATRQTFFMGYGPRSSREARAVVQDLFGVTAISLELVDPRFYHLDTAFCALSGGEALYYPPAFSPEGRRLLADVMGEANLIAVEDEDAAVLAANAVCLGRDVVFGACSPRLASRLAERGYRVRRVPIAAFGRSGGSAYCLTLRLDRTSAAAREGAAAFAPVGG
jgi:N-dimethylarginine dimethylaminohydrolase